VIKEMRQADILLVPSHYEPGGIVVGEALANGMIVVASDEAGSAEDLPTSVCHRFPAGDGESFRAAIESAIKNIEESGRKRRNEAMQTAREKFDPKRMAELLLSEVSRLTAHRRVQESVAAPSGMRAALNSS